MSNTPTTTPAPLLLRPRDAARALSISERTLWALTQPRGPIPCVRVGVMNRSIRYDLLDLRAFIEGQKQRPPAERREAMKEGPR